ncbi:hypothetical protein HKX48_005984 [Thoreauomyces humboldtii]|nr:hypothetical protein HKX48_005984 [Thoreauomyces humboldtii]
MTVDDDGTETFEDYMDGFDVASEDPHDTEWVNVDVAGQYSCFDGDIRALVIHTVCLGLFRSILWNRDRSKPNEFWDVDGATCLSWSAGYCDPPVSLALAIPPDGKPPPHSDRLHPNDDGVFKGFHYGNEDLHEQTYQFDPARTWMLARPDKFPAPKLLADMRKCSFGNSPFAVLPVELLVQLVGMLHSKQFSIAGVTNILPEGMDGLAVIIGSGGAMLDQIDLAGLFGASIAGGWYDASWVAAGNAITEFVSSNSAVGALYPTLR